MFTANDLLDIARTEADDGKALAAKLGKHFTAVPPSTVGLQDENAVIWKGGNFEYATGIQPVCHSLTDAYALLGTLAAVDVLQLPFFAVPMPAQYRHDQSLKPLDWFGNVSVTSIKWSTAGDKYVDDGEGGQVVVHGKSGNAPLRTAAGVYCNVRPYGPITAVRCMPCLPYSQDKKMFNVDPETGIIHSEMNTPGVNMAYAGRHFLQMVHEGTKTNPKLIGRVAFKPTQAQEDGINAGLLSWMLRKTKIEIGRKYAVDCYDEHCEKIDRIIALLPDNFCDGMEEWSGRVEQHISDTNYGILLWDMIDQQETIIIATDLDGDRLTDLMADVTEPLIHFAGKVARHLGHKDVDAHQLWKDMGYTTGNGRDMTSVMYRMDGPPIHEQTLGSADAMLLRLLDGDESMGGKKRPYDPRIHFVLIRDAYLDANPDNEELRAYLDEALAKFDEIYGGKRPGFLEGFERLKAAIRPWGMAA